MNRLSRNEEAIRKVVESTEFKMADADWQAARQLLDEHLPPTRKKRRRALWWLFFPLAALLVVGGWLAYNELYKKPGVVAAPEEKSLITDTLAHTPITDIVSGSGIKPSTGTGGSKAEDNDDHNKSNAGTAEGISAGPGPLMAARYAEQGYTLGSGSGAVNVPSTGGTSEGEKNSVPYSKKGDSGGEPAANPTKKAKGNDADPGKGDPGGTKPGKTNQPPANPPAKDSGAAPGITPSSAPGSTPGKSVNPAKETPKENNTLPVIPTVVETPVKPVSDTEKPAEDEPEGADSAVKENKATKKKNEPREVKNTISLIVGWNYYRTLNPFQTRYAQTPWFGLMYNRYLGLKWQLGLGLGYTRVNSDSLNKTYATEKYSFGVTSTQTTISTQALHYLDIPVIARYELLNRLWLMGGINTSLLLNTSNRVQEYGYTSLSGGTVTSRDATAYRNGFSSFDIQLMLGAEFSLAERWKLGLLYNTGLVDVTLNSYYNNRMVNRNTRLQVYLRYDLFRF